MMGDKFTGLVRERRLSKNLDVYSACYEVLLEVLKDNNVPRTNENFKLGAENIEYNPYIKIKLKRNISSMNNTNNIFIIYKFQFKKF